MQKLNTYKSSQKGFSATQNIGLRQQYQKTHKDYQQSPLRTNDNSICNNTYGNTTNSTTISAKYQQSQVKLQQHTANSTKHAQQRKLMTLTGLKTNSISKCDIVDERSISECESPLDQRKHQYKISTPQESNNPIQKLNYQSYTKTHQQTQHAGNRYNVPSYSSLNQTKLQQQKYQQYTGRVSNTTKQIYSNNKKHKYLFPATTTAKADISTPKKEKQGIISGQHSHKKQASGPYSTKNSDAKYHKKNNTSYGATNPNLANQTQPALFSNQKSIKDSFVHKNLDLYLKQKYKVNNLLQKDQESMKNLQSNNHNQDQSFDNLVSSFAQVKTTKNQKNSDRNSTLKRNNTAKYLNLTKAKYGQQYDKQVQKKRYSYNNVKPNGNNKKKKHKYNPKGNSSLTKLTIDFRKYNNNNADVSHDISMDTHLEILNQSPQNVIYSSLKKKREYEFQQQQQQQQYANKLQRQLSYDLLKRSRSKSTREQNNISDVKQFKNSQSLSNLMLQHMKNINGTNINGGSTVTGSGVFDYTNTQIVQGIPLNTQYDYQEQNSSADLRLQKVSNECVMDGQVSSKDHQLKSPKRLQYNDNNEGIVPYHQKVKSPSVLVHNTNHSLGGQKSTTVRSRSRSPIKIHNQVTKHDTLSSYQSSNVHGNGCRTTTNQQQQQNHISNGNVTGRGDQLSEHAAKLECFTQYIEQVKQVREERSSSKRRESFAKTNNSRSRTSFVVAAAHSSTNPHNHNNHHNNGVHTTTAAAAFNRPISSQLKSNNNNNNLEGNSGAQTPHSTIALAMQAANSAKHQNLLRKQLSQPVPNQQQQLPSDNVIHNSEFGAYNITQISEYKLGKVLGQGAYAVVKEGVHKTLGSSLAIKVYDKYKLIDVQRKRSVIREIKILKKMQHENIVTLFDAIDTQRQLYLVMENVEGTCLQSMLKMIPNRRVNEEEGAKIFMQIISAMEYVHNQDVAHRDIKLENILIENSSRKVKLIDFGFCCQAKERLKVFCGTPSYMSPEIVMKRDYYGGPNDIWACGVLLYVLLCGTFPFKSAFEKDLFRKIARGQFSFPDNLVLSDEAKDLLSQILQVNPDKRPTATQILEHDWFARQGVVCKPVYQIEINSSLVTSGAEDIQQSTDSGIKPYQIQMKSSVIKVSDDQQESRTIKTQSSSSVVSNDMILSVGTEGSNAIKCIERVQMKINQQQRCIGSGGKQMDKVNNNNHSLTNNSGKEIMLNSHIIDMTARHSQQQQQQYQKQQQQQQTMWQQQTHNFKHSNTADIIGGGAANDKHHNKKVSNHELPYHKNPNYNKLRKVNTILLDP